MKVRAMAALQTYDRKKEEDQVRSKERSFTYRLQVKNPIWKKI